MRQFGSKLGTKATFAGVDSLIRNRPGATPFEPTGRPLPHCDVEDVVPGGIVASGIRTPGRGARGPPRRVPPRMEEMRPTCSPPRRSRVSSVRRRGPKAGDFEEVPERLGTEELPVRPRWHHRGPEDERAAEPGSALPAPAERTSEETANSPEPPAPAESSRRRSARAFPARRKRRSISRVEDPGASEPPRPWGRRSKRTERRSRAPRPWPPLPRIPSARGRRASAPRPARAGRTRPASPALPTTRASRCRRRSRPRPAGRPSRNPERRVPPRRAMGGAGRPTGRKPAPARRAAPGSRRG